AGAAFAHPVWARGAAPLGGYWMNIRATFIGQLASSLDLPRRLGARLLLSRAKHPSLQGHGQMARHLASLVPFYQYGEETFCRSDGAPEDVASLRRAGFERLSRCLRERAPKTLAESEKLEQGLSDLAFVNAYRIPFQYRSYVQKHLRVGA